MLEVDLGMEKMHVSLDTCSMIFKDAMNFV